MFGKKPRFSIAWLMVVVSILAVDLGLLRAVRHMNIELALIFLPSLNFMLLGLPKLRRGHESRPFWIGFEAAALILIGLVMAVIWRAPDFFIFPWEWLLRHKWIDSDMPFIVGSILFATLYALPQLLAASIAGWWLAGYRLVIVRRPPAQDAAVLAFPSEGTDSPRTSRAFGETPHPAIE